ncbi:MAG: hypothetical protein SWZ49_04150, partial [Cyanobacteriota bacterium]|nr:hypothetical protein [Cyanobacteriota bacterium]
TALMEGCASPRWRRNRGNDKNSVTSLVIKLFTLSEYLTIRSSLVFDNGSLRYNPHPVQLLSINFGLSKSVA